MLIDNETLETHTSYESRGFFIVSHETHDTQTTMISGTSSYETHDFACRLIGWVAEGIS